jgi:ABC-type multidrug transport system ATPase subunit
MRIEASDISKKLGRQWVVKHFTHQFDSGRVFGISGDNGSGKSTLLQLISTFMEPTKGSCRFVSQDKPVPEKDIYKCFSVAAPYLQLIPHLTIREQLHFTWDLKGWSHQLTTQNVLQATGLEQHADKALQQLSSGMKQRIRLISALAADVPFVFLDEPTTNLDAVSKRWFLEQCELFRTDKSLIIASNEAFDLQLCTETLEMANYK